MLGIVDTLYITHYSAAFEKECHMALCGMQDLKRRFSAQKSSSYTAFRESFQKDREGNCQLNSFWIYCFSKHQPLFTHQSKECLSNRWPLAA